jgi:putative intracellular protease/amidase
MQASRLLLVVLLLINKALLPAQETKVLVLLPDKYGANFNLNYDNFRNLGWSITIAGTTKTIKPCPVYAAPLGCMPVKADLLISDIENTDGFDCIAVMSGSHWARNPCGDIIADTSSIRLIQEAVKKNKVVIAFCTGTRVLAAADVIKGRKVTGNWNYEQEYLKAGADFMGKNIPPVIDGNIITCTAGDFYNVHNCESVIKLLTAPVTEAGSIQELFRYENANLHQASRSLLYTNNMNSGATNIIRLTKGGYVATGFTFDGGYGKSDVFLTFLDDSFNLKNLIYWGHEGWEYPYGLAESKNGDILITGLTNSPGTSGGDIFVACFNRKGRKKWEHTYGGKLYDTGRSIHLDENGSIYVLGTTVQSGDDPGDMYLLKLNSEGNQIWDKRYGGRGSQMGYKIIADKTGNLILAGNNGNFTENQGNRDIYLIKTDKDGNILWEREYPLEHQQWGFDICLTNDGGYLIAGNNDVTYRDLYSIYVLKVDEDGEEEWNRSYGEGSFYDYGVSVMCHQTGEIFLGGVSKTQDRGSDIYIVNIDKNGTLRSKNLLGSEKNEWLTSMLLDNGKLVFCGWAERDPDKKQAVLIGSTGIPTPLNK